MIEPVVKDVWVAADPAVAFARFTDGVDTWWPRSTHSVTEARCAAVRFECRQGGRLYEVDDQGVEHEWGVVRVWDPPTRLVFSWHPGKDETMATEVEVAFASERDGTAVHVEHRGWEVLGAPAAETRDQYEGGWTPVLGLYVDAVGSARGAATPP